MADDDGPGPQPGDEALEPVEAVEVEVVGGLVEQHDVEAGQQQGREAGARGLPAGQRRHGQAGVDVEPDLGQHRGRPVLEVGRAQGEPLLERGGVLVVGAGRALAERLGRRVHPRLGRRDPGAPGEVGHDRLAGAALGLLREVPDRGAGRVEDDRAGVGLGLAGQHAQQGRLAGAVGPDEPDDVAGRDDEVEAGEQGALGVAGREAAGDEGGGHGADPPSRDARAATDLGQGGGP